MPCRTNALRTVSGTRPSSLAVAANVTPSFTSAAAATMAPPAAYAMSLLVVFRVTFLD
jgi:hypothetical protein